MKKYIETHPWKIIETDFSLNDNMVTESLLAIGNGRMGQKPYLKRHLPVKALEVPI
jgi:maltose phosphorylase